MQNTDGHSFFSENSRSRAKSSSAIPIPNSGKNLSEPPRARTLSMSTSANSYHGVPLLSFFYQQKNKMAYSLPLSPSPIAHELAQTLFVIERTIDLLDPEHRNTMLRMQVEQLHKVNTWFHEIQSVKPSEVMAAEKKHDLKTRAAQVAFKKPVEQDEKNSPAPKHESEGLFQLDL